MIELRYCFEPFGEVWNIFARTCHGPCYHAFVYGAGRICLIFTQISISCVCAYEMFTSKFDVESKINTTVQLLFLWSDGLLIFVIQIGNGDSIKF